MRLLFPLGIFTTYLVLLGNMRYGKEKVPFLKVFDRIKSTSTRGGSFLLTISISRVIVIRSHLFRLYLGFLGLRFTKKRVLMRNNRFKVFLVLFGSTIFFSFFRYQLNKIYYPNFMKNKKGVGTKIAVIFSCA